MQQFYRHAPHKDYPAGSSEIFGVGLTKITILQRKGTHPPGTNRLSSQFNRFVRSYHQADLPRGIASQRTVLEYTPMDNDNLQREARIRLIAACLIPLAAPTTRLDIFLHSHLTSSTRRQEPEFLRIS